MDGPTQKPKVSWLELLRNSGDDDLGAGLIRLAKLAAATHQVEAELDAEANEAAWLDDARELQGRSSESVARTGVTLALRGRNDAGPFHREVKR